MIIAKQKITIIKKRKEKKNETIFIFYSKLFFFLS